MRLRTIQGDPVVVTGSTPAVVRTVTAPSSTVILPGETVQNTVTEVNTVTETVQNSVTETVTVTAPVTAPTP
jgi:hypothetical protein